MRFVADDGELSLLPIKLDQTEPRGGTMEPTDNFFSVFDPTKMNYRNLDYLMNQFSEAPSIGIASGAGPVGPQVTGYANVRALFERLFQSFPHLSFMANPPYWSDKNTIIVLGTLTTDLMRNPRLQKSNGNSYSKPLLDIVPDWVQSLTVQACATFTFDAAGNTIDQLRIIYMDRCDTAVDDLAYLTVLGRDRPIRIQ
jgi:hypothetical protein